MDLVHRARPAYTPKVTPYTPLLSVAPWLPSAGAALALGDVAGLSGSDLLIAPVSLVLCGLWGAGRSFLDRRRLRSSADGWNAQGHDDPTSWCGCPGSPLYAPPSFAAAVETPERTIRAVRDALEVC